MSGPAAEASSAGRFALGDRAERQPSTGVAFEARDPATREAVTVTVLTGADRDEVDRFLAQATMLEELSHRGLPRVLDQGRDEAGAWFATSPIRGTALSELIRSEGPFAPMRAIRLLGEVADAIDAVHAKGFVHGHVAAEDILVRDLAVERTLLWDFLPAHDGAEAAADRAALARVLVHALIGPEAPGGGQAASLPAGFEPVIRSAIAGDPDRAPSSATLLFSQAARVLIASPGMDEQTPAPAEGAAGRAAPHPAPREAAPHPEPLRVPPEREPGTEPGPPASPGPLRVPRDPAPASGPPASPAPLRVPPPGAKAAPPTPAPLRVPPKPEPSTPGPPPPPAAPAAPAPVAAEPPARSRRLRPALAAVALLAVVGAGAAGFLLGRSGEEEAPAAAKPVKESAGPVSISRPADWSKGGGAPALALSDTVTAQDGQGRLLAGLRKGPNGMLFPARTADAVIADPGDPVAVRAGSLDGLRFRGDGRSGKGKAALFLFPTSEGTLVVSCTGPGDAFVAACERSAGSARLAGATAVDPGALASYARRTSRVLSSLNANRVRDRRSLRRARQRPAQARAARRLAATYRRAARSVPRGAPPQLRGETRRLAATLNRTAAAYSALAGAARQGDGRRYRAAAAALRRSEARVARAVRRL